MNVANLLQNLDVVVNAPKGITTLRQLVLKLGISGRLVIQRNDEMPAKELISHVSSSLDSSDAFNPLRQNIDTLLLNESMYRLPIGWTWIALGNLGRWASGCGFPKRYQGSKSDEIPFCKVSDMNLPGNERFINTTENTISSSVATTLHAKPNPVGTVVFPKIGGAIATNKRRLISRPTVIDNNCLGIQPIGLTDPGWLLILLKSIDFAQYQSGTSVPSISQNSLNPIRIGLPPLEEQKRIVAKVDELMRLCDRLEAQQQEREKLLPLLSRANHTRFVVEPTVTHLQAIFRVPGRTSPSDLKESILKLAFRGMLEAQDSSEEPASHAISRIGQGTTPQRRSRASSGERSPYPFALPSGWSWATFPELGEFGRGKSRHRPRNDRRLYDGGTYKLVQTGDVARANGTVTTHTNAYNDFGLAQSKLWPVGTLCITIAANIADSGILGFEACIPDSVVGFVPSEVFPSVRYFEYFLRTIKTDLEAFAPSTAQKNINIGILEKVHVPIAPVEEQRRIVARIDHLLEMIDRLEKTSNAASVLGHDFAIAAVAAITSTEFKVNETMKPPKTEVVTALKVGIKPKKPDAAPLATLLSEQKAEASAKTLWQLSGLEIDAFYRQLKTEMANGWIEEDEDKRAVKEVEAR